MNLKEMKAKIIADKKAVMPQANYATKEIEKALFFCWTPSRKEEIANIIADQMLEVLAINGVTHPREENDVNKS